jgi:hypothetical protein
MKKSRFSLLGLLFMLCAVCLTLGLLADTASAQESVNKSADKTIATKKGVAQSLGSKEIEENKLPGKLEVGLGVGSCVVMVAVMKWL